MRLSIKKNIFCFLIVCAITLTAQTLPNRPSPPVGQQFYDVYNSIYLSVESTNGVEWYAINNMKNVPLKVTFTVQGGGQSATENATLNNYSSFVKGALGRNETGGSSLTRYTISGTATCSSVPVDQVGNIGAISVSYYGVE